MLMEQIYHPTKEQVRKWLSERQSSREPPPDIAQIQRILGWKPPARREDSTNTGVGRPHITRRIKE
jgi:hypothetical protein